MVLTQWPAFNFFFLLKCQQVIFEGIVGTSFTSDAAIDEISFVTGACKQTGKFTIKQYNSLYSVQLLYL